MSVSRLFFSRALFSFVPTFLQSWTVSQQSSISFTAKIEDYVYSSHVARLSSDLSSTVVSRPSCVDDSAISRSPQHVSRRGEFGTLRDIKSRIFQTLLNFHFSTLVVNIIFYFLFLLYIMMFEESSPFCCFSASLLPHFGCQP